MGILNSRIFSVIRKIGKQDIIRVFSFTAISTLVRMCTGLISIKVVAIIIGPGGIALLGQLNNFSTIVMSFATGGINNGVTKYVAEFKESDNEVKSILSTALRITLTCSFIVGLLMMIGHRYLSNIIMLSPDYGYIFVIFGFTIFLYALNTMLISIINGYKEFKKYVSINIAGSLVGLLFSLGLVFSFGLKGALIGAVTYQSVVFFITLWMIRKLPWTSWKYFKTKFDILIAKKFFKYTLMTLISSMLVPVSQMILRGYVISEISPTEAGWWEGMNRISGMYLLIITSSFSVYYLPRLSELKDRLELKREILKAYKVIIPMLLIGFSLIYFLRFIIIRILFTPEFLPMQNLFIWQLLGDFFKISSWLLAFIMVAKALTKKFIVTEIIFSSLFIGLGFLFINFNGVVGITQAYFINYLLYMITMCFIFKKILFIS